MTKDEFYKIVNDFDSEIRKKIRIERRLEQIEINVDLKVGKGSEIQNNNNNDILHDLVCEKADLENKLKELSVVIEYKKQEIKRVVNKVDNEVFRDLLYYKYVKRLSWYDIANILNYSVEHAKGQKFREAKKQLWKSI